MWELEPSVKVTDLALTDVDVQIATESIVKLILGTGSTDGQFTQTALYCDVRSAETWKLHQNDNLIVISVEEGINSWVEGDWVLKVLWRRNLENSVLGDSSGRLVDDGWFLGVVMGLDWKTGGFVDDNLLFGLAARHNARHFEIVGDSTSF